MSKSQTFRKCGQEKIAKAEQLETYCQQGEEEIENEDCSGILKHSSCAGCQSTNCNLSITATARTSLWLTLWSVLWWSLCEISRTLPSGYASGSHVPGLKTEENTSQLGKSNKAGCSAAFGHSGAVNPDPAQKIVMCEWTSIYGSVRTARPILGIGDKAVLWLCATRTEKSNSVTVSTPLCLLTAKSF